MRLHIAAQAFPTYQGTQAIVRKMLEAECAAGVHAELVTYAAAGYSDRVSFAVHRPRRLPFTNASALLRSGPTLAKPWLDAQLVAHLRSLLRRLRPQVLVAHHVEAALVALACGGPPVIFYAHTDFADELPTYASPRWSKWLAIAGGGLERWIVRRAAATVTISPLLRDRLLRHGPRVHHVSPPFETIGEACDRNKCRQALGLGVERAVVLYAGNLDAYQGVDTLPQVLVELAALGVDATLLVATESDPRSFLAWARRAEVGDRVGVVGLAGEAQRARVHAAADVVIVPRRSVGGLPIKLLDAMARGVPVVASPAAVAGYRLENACLIAKDAGARALAHGVATLLTQQERRSLLIEAGQRYLLQTHSSSLYLSGMEAITRNVIASSQRSSFRTRR